MTLTDPILFGLTESVYTRIARLVLEEKDVPYKLEQVDIFSHQGAPTQYLERNPFGRIPAFTHGELSLYETSAITRYVDEAFDGPALQPESFTQRARLNQIISMMDSYAYRPMIWDVFVERIVVPQEGGNPNEDSIAAALPIVGICLDELDLWLGEQAYLLGSQATLADLHAVPMLFYLAQTTEGQQLLAAKPKLTHWLEKMQSRPSFTSTRSIHG